MEEYNLLLSNPILFFTDSGAGSENYGGVLDASYSFWADFRFILLYKFIGLLNLLTAGNFYLNSVVFSSIVFIGHIAFYRIYDDLYPGHRVKVFMICFLLPSILMYTACVHKDGLVFLFTAIISFIFYTFLKRKAALGFKFISILVLSILGIFLFRNYVLMALLPAMFTALLCKTLPYNKKLVVGISYAAYALLFFLSGYIHPSFNFPGAVIKRRSDFASLAAGSTDIPMNELYPTAASFILNMPQAINHAVFRPYLWEFRGVGVMLTALELLFYQVIFIFFIFLKNKKESVLHNYNVYAFGFFMTMVLIIGYTIPNVGAIVRYRSLLWIFVLCPMVCCIDWARLAFWRAKR